MLDEVRRAPLDDAGRRALREIHESSLHELEGVLSPDLQQELEDVVAPVHAARRRASRSCGIAQAQLVGWLEGLFHGIQATLFTQQAQAQQQLERDAASAARSSPARPASGRPAPTSRPRSR